MREEEPSLADLLGLKKEKHIIPDFPEFDRLFMSLDELKKLEKRKG